MYRKALIGVATFLLLVATFSGKAMSSSPGSGLYRPDAFPSGVSLNSVTRVLERKPFCYATSGVSPSRLALYRSQEPATYSRYLNLHRYNGGGSKFAAAEIEELLNDVYNGRMRSSRSIWLSGYRTAELMESGQSGSKCAVKDRYPYLSIEQIHFALSNKKLGFVYNGKQKVFMSTKRKYRNIELKPYKNGYKGEEARQIVRQGNVADTEFLAALYSEFSWLKPQ